MKDVYDDAATAAMLGSSEQGGVRVGKKLPSIIAPELMPQSAAAIGKTAAAAVGGAEVLTLLAIVADEEAEDADEIEIVGVVDVTAELLVVVVVVVAAAKAPPDAIVPRCC